MQAWKEKVQFIEDDTPIRIILDDEISVLRGKLLPHWHEALEVDLVLKGEMVYIIDGSGNWICYEMKIGGGSVSNVMRRQCIDQTEKLFKCALRNGAWGIVLSK